ncbi:hypothetical protein [Kribbella karoonensis]|uniref:Uncharacterized protein n=1 Tax=Kribbella karoonensis TaxID=324851 RepID=A0ABN2ELH7_9ACTN
MFQPGDRDRRRAQRLIRRGARHLAAGRVTEAVEVSKDAEQLVRSVIAVSNSRQDRRVLGSILYNRAANLEWLRNTDAAYYAASAAAEAYHSVDPTWGSPKLIPLALAGERIPPAESGGLYRILRITDEAERNRQLFAISEPHRIGWDEIQEVIAQAADARVRSRRLGALTGLEDLEHANLDHPAETYRQLIIHGDRYTTTDLNRIETQITETRRLLTGS